MRCPSKQIYNIASKFVQWNSIAWACFIFLLLDKFTRHVIIFFCGYSRARHPISSYLSKNILFEIFKSYSWSYDKMLIDWVKSDIIPSYTYEVTAFPRLEIFVKHRSLYDSLHLSVGPAEFSQLQCFSSKIIVFSRALGIMPNNKQFILFNTSPFNLPPATSYTWQ